MTKNNRIPKKERLTWMFKRGLGNESKRQILEDASVSVVNGLPPRLPPITNPAQSSMASGLSNSLLSSLTGGGLSLASSSSNTTTSSRSFPRDHRAPRRTSDEISGNVLHVACQSHPPVHILKLLVEECGISYASELNAIGQTPLHIAAARGASPHVIEYLIDICPYAASVQDDKGRTPLHLACECSRRGSGWCDTGTEDSRGRDRIERGPLPSVITALINASPDSVNAIDHKRRNPLEYAIALGAGSKVVKALHKASERNWQDPKPDMGDEVQEGNGGGVSRGESNGANSAGINEGESVISKREESDGSGGNSERNRTIQRRGGAGIKHITESMYATPNS